MNTKKNSLITQNQITKLKKELTKEINEDYKAKLKNLVKYKMVRIRKTEKLLETQKIELNDILYGKKLITEDEILNEYKTDNCMIEI